MNDQDNKRKSFSWWIELLRAVLAALAGLLGGTVA